MQSFKLVLVITAALLAVCTMAAPHSFCQELLDPDTARQNKRAMEMDPKLGGPLPLDPEDGLIPSSSPATTSTSVPSSSAAAISTSVPFPSAAAMSSPAHSPKHGHNIHPVHERPTSTLPVYTMPTDEPSAGFIPSTCDWETGIHYHGAGKKECVALCKDTFGHQEECNGSRCIAIDGPENPGKCFCTCNCPLPRGSFLTDAYSPPTNDRYWDGEVQH